jgi:hypothetical protein
LKELGAARLHALADLCKVTTGLLEILKESRDRRRRAARTGPIAEGEFVR